MSKNLIFCFSGTGNSYFVAENIAKKLHNTDIVLFNSGFSLNSCDGYDTVGFIYPCHGGGLPIGFFEAISNIEVSFNCYTYAICTYSVYYGNTFDKINSIIPLDYWNGISHHCSCNWLFQHNMMIPPFLSSYAANKRARRLCDKISNNIIARHRIEENVPKKIINKAERVVYNYLASSIIEKFEVSDNCTKCGLCSKICINNNISIEGNKITIGHNCTQCLRCLQFCPNNSISIKGKKTHERYHNPDVDLILLTKKLVHID